MVITHILQLKLIMSMLGKMVIALLILHLTALSQAQQIIPENYVVNRPFSSNPQMGCGVFTSSRVSKLTCNNPSASVLFDGVIPSVIDNTEWERQLLRLRNNSTITFNFGSMTSVAISVIEIVFYNCPLRNTGAAAFVIRTVNQIAAIGNTNGVSSCDHLIKICFSPTLQLSTVLSLQSIHPLVDIYLAEMIFHNNTEVCNEAVSIVRSTRQHYTTLAGKEIPTSATQCLRSETSSSVPVAVIILSITTGASLIVITVLCVIIAHLITKKKNISTGAIYEIPKEVNPGSFNMTQSSVYGIHENRK